MQFDYRKGCAPRWRCGGNADGKVTEEEFITAAVRDDRVGRSQYTPFLEW